MKITPKFELTCSIIAGVLLGAGWIIKAAASGTEGAGIGGALIWASLTIGMFFGVRAAWSALTEHKVDIDVLMVVGATLAAYIGHPTEGALLLFLFVLSGALEDLAMQRTEREVSALSKLMPSVAIRLNPADGQWAEVKAEELAAGDRIKVRPGDRVPTDAVVAAGTSSFDQSAITGESMPRRVKVGDELYAGTINSDDPIEATVTRPVRESSLARILNMVTSAREQREPIQRTIDRLSQPYSIAVMVLSLAVVLVWRYVLGRPWSDASLTAITFLIVCSPCALVIATPTATLAAISRAARAGVLFKGGQAIERLSRIGSVCFDKTGTLTIGRPRLVEIHPVAWSDGAELLGLAAGLEQESTHPIAAAIREAARLSDIEPLAVTDIDHTAGRGMSGNYKGCPVRLGSYKFTQDLIPVCFRSLVQETLARIQEQGQIGVVTAHACPEKPGGGEAAVFIMADAVRPGAHTLVEKLHALRVRPVRMLTGDNRRTAEKVAASLNLDRVDAELMPEDKLKAVAEMKAQAAQEAAGSGVYRGVAVIGDGVNDAPALAAADVSIAIGSIGSDAALESADIVLLSDDLASVPWAVELAWRARRTVKTNFTFALGIIILMAIATLAGSLWGLVVPMWMGVLAHEGGTLLVVANSLRLLGHRGMPPSPGMGELAPPTPVVVRTGAMAT
jgi:Cd2+/Zn2+-exporting ATPase